MFKRIFLATAVISAPVFADPPVINAVNVEKSGGAWRFDVTLSHDDTGWDHYADGWRIIDSAGNELGHRKLAHPHVNEQPFTRSLSSVQIPDDISEVGIQARDNITGWGGEIKMVKLK